ncbi:MAG: HYR domain-containing protein, partial [bacterium]
MSGTSNVIVYTVTDVNGNTSTCSSTVTLIDTNVPSIACPADITVGTDVDQCVAVVPYSIPTAADNCPNVSIVRTSGQASGTAFSTGVNTVEY